MSDQIFNYFSSKGTRKVDPIDDAEFDSIDQPEKPLDPPKSNQTADIKSDSGQSAGELKVSQGSSTSSRPQPANSDDPGSRTAPKKSQSHWDYLASFLGIKKEAPAAEVALETAVAKLPERSDVASHGPETGATLFDVAEEPAREQAILEELFSPNRSSSDIALESDAAGVGDSDVGLEYVEFEVEDLNGDDADDSPRRTRRSSNREADDRNRSDRGRSRRESASRDQRGRRDRDDAPAAESRYQPRVRADRDDSPKPSETQREQRSDTKRVQRRDERDVPQRGFVREIPADAFGAGIFEAPVSRDEFESDAGQGHKKRRRRRRSRGGSKSESDAVSGLPRMSPVPEVDPPENFFYETGWQPTSSEKVGRKDVADHHDDFADDRENTAARAGVKEHDRESDLASDSDRPRRRRRGRKPTADSTLPYGSEARINRSAARRPEPREDFEVDHDDFDYDRVHRHPKNSGQADEELRSRDKESRQGDDREEKKRKFPTWEEAIAGMVESNIKNHSRSSGHNRSPNKRGRRRR